MKSNKDESHIDARGYQLEVFERSKFCNIIAVLPTNTGKTMIAILRLKYETERQTTKVLYIQEMKDGMRKPSTDLLVLGMHIFNLTPDRSRTVVQPYIGANSFSL